MNKPEYQFTAAFAKDNLNYLINTLGCPRSYLEIGVYEGNTFFYLVDILAKNFSDTVFWCLDPHDESFDIKDDLQTIKKRFQHNLSISPYIDRIKYIQRDSFHGLMDIYDNGMTFDFIYIDGDHRSSTVMEDLVLSWRILNPGGVILLDDTHGWTPFENSSITDTPRLAVEAFIQIHWNDINVLPIPGHGQTAFMKKQKGN